ncbi:MAG: hypothetical protein ACQCN4_02535 [Candidatus Bathyarchaeia archaeon]|jgi:hypothetical protein
MEKEETDCATQQTINQCSDDSLVINVEFTPIAFVNYAHLVLSILITKRADESTRLFLKSPPNDSIAWLLNTYATGVSVQPYGFTAYASKNVGLALAYFIAQPNKRLTQEELAEIVSKGTTRRHSFLSELGIDIDPSAFEILSTAKINNQSLNVEKFPIVIVDVKSLNITVALDANNIDRPFLKDLLQNEIENETSALLKGISLLEQPSQIRYMQLLSEDNLQLPKIAKTLYKTANSTSKKAKWVKIADWLRKNSYTKEASTLIASKTLLGLT